MGKRSSVTAPEAHDGPDPDRIQYNLLTDHPVGDCNQKKGIE